MKRIFSVLFILCSVSAFAQETPETAKKEEPAPVVSEKASVPAENLNHAIGLTAGFVTGLGLSYLYAPEGWGFKASFLPVVESSGERLVCGGICGMKNIYESDVLTAFFYAGTSVWYSRTYDYDNYYDYTRHYTTEYSTIFTVGPGVRLKVERLGLEVMTGYGLYLWDVKDRDWSSSLTIEASAYFFF
jgi:hypothetical protein